MNWLIHTIAQLFRMVVSLMRRTRLSREWQEDLYESGGDREAVMRHLGEDADSRKRVVHAIGPRASSDGIGGESELFTYVDEEGTQTVIDYRTARRCDCGTLIGYKDVSLFGTCQICARTVCNQEGCASRCEKCGSIVCGRHKVELGGHVFCPHHRLYGLWLGFWGLLK